MLVFTSAIKFNQSVSKILNLALISGVVSGILGAASGALGFVTTYGALTNYAYLSP
jgi:hypothetical protein